MGCVIAGIGLGILTLVLCVVGFSFLGIDTDQVLNVFIGIGFLIGAIMSGFGMVAAFNE